MGVPKVAGIETEYGIMITGADESDPFHASQLVLSAHPHVGHGAVPCRSSYGFFQGQNITLDETVMADDAELGRVVSVVEDELFNGPSMPSAASMRIRRRLRQFAPRASAETVRSTYVETDLMLANGARYYIDHAHPEYSTPECLSPRSLVAADKAGERILAACQQWVNASGLLPLQQQVQIYKNNSDYKNNSYGCHENYLLSADLFNDLQYHKVHKVFRYLIPFLVTRMIVCGSGKVGAENGKAPIGFQLSQRADFFESLIGLQTTFNRPLFNTRDEPHVNAMGFRRLHVIPGDANMSEFSTYLKVGTTQLVLEMLEDNFIKTDMTLSNPLQALYTVSRDLTFMQPLQLEDGRQMTALEIQEAYLDLTDQYLQEKGGSDEQRAVLETWADALSMLPDDWEQLATRFDWAIKRRLLERYLHAQGAQWSQVAAWQAIIEEPDQDHMAREMAKEAQLPWQDYEQQRNLYFALRRLDLQYHDIRSGSAQGESGLFYHLQQRGAIERLLTDEEIQRLVTQPPPDTRAWLRGQCIKDFAPLITAADWSRLNFYQPASPSHRENQLDLLDPFMGTEEMMAPVWSQLHEPSAVIAYCLSSFKGQEIHTEQETP